jgi:predicted permease
MSDIIAIFLNVIMPVFGIVLLGYLLGDRLELQTQTLTRSAYYVFVPAFIFQAISSSRIPLDQAAKMTCFIVVAHLLAALVAGGVGRLLGHSRDMIAAFIMIAVAGNVGNYGLAMVRFRLGEEAIAPATLYYVVLSITIFVVCVAVAGWAHGGSRGALWKLLKTPAIWAVVPALMVSNSDIAVPLMLTRLIGLLADAMIPVMLFSLGLQLLEQRQIKLSRDVFTASALRLLVTPAIACLVAIPFGLGQLEYTAGILQSAMPTAVMAAIIAREHQIVPHFVTTVVVFTLLASLVTLTILMIFL